MWEWFTANGLWVLIASAAGMIILIFLLHQIHDRIEKIHEKEERKGLDRAIHITIWSVLGIGSVLVVISFIALIVSREGVGAEITGETIQDWLLKHGIFILAIVALTYLACRFIKMVMPKLVGSIIQVRGKGRRAKEEQAKRIQTLSGVLVAGANIIITLAAIFIILDDIGINIAPILAGAGVAGIAIGFGAQSLVKDLLRGLLIFMQDQYGKGDVVRVAGIGGLVEDVNLFRTVLRDLDGILHSIPNSEITTASNFTRDWSRINLNVSVAYKENLTKVFQVINAVCQELKDDPVWGKDLITTPHVERVDNLGDNGIDIKILGDTKPIRQWALMGELRKRLKDRFDEEDIEIPWPHTKVYFGNAPVDNSKDQQVV